MMTMTILSLVLAVGFVLAVSTRNGVPKSISALAYTTGWLWTIAVELCVFILMPLMTGYDDTYAGVAFASCASIGFVGAMPLFIRETNKAHDILATTGAVLSQLWVALVWDWKMLAAWWTAYLIPLLINKNKWCFWAEIWCLVSLLWTIFEK